MAQRDMIIYHIMFAQPLHARVLGQRLQGLRFDSISDKPVRKVLEKCRDDLLQDIGISLAMQQWWPNLWDTDQRGQSLRKNLRYANQILKIAPKHVQPHQQAVLRNFEDITGRLSYLANKM